MSEFNCLVVVLFSAMFSCFLLDSFELQEMVCVTKHGATFSSLNFSRCYDEHACDTIFFFLMLETEELISEVGSHQILQEASELSGLFFFGSFVTFVIDNLVLKLCESRFKLPTSWKIRDGDVLREEIF